MLLETIARRKIGTRGKYRMLVKRNTGDSPECANQRVFDCSRQGAE
jgi:hypothetical protein